MVKVCRYRVDCGLKRAIAVVNQLRKLVLQRRVFRIRIFFACFFGVLNSGIEFGHLFVKRSGVGFSGDSGFELGFGGSQVLSGGFQRFGAVDGSVTEHAHAVGNARMRALLNGQVIYGFAAVIGGVCILVIRGSIRPQRRAAAILVMRDESVALGQHLRNPVRVVNCTVGTNHRIDLSAVNL